MNKDIYTQAKEMLKKVKKIPVILISLLLIIKYAFFFIDYDKFHVVVSIATFSFYFVGLFYLIKYVIKKKKIVLTNIFILFFLLFIGEFVCYLLLGAPMKEWKSYETSDLPEDHIGLHLGHVPWADSVWHDVKINGADTVFDTYYTIDELNRRVTPDYNEKKDKFAIFFGCSIGFGFGLKDDQTIPYYFQQNTEAYNSYNYAYNGWGSNHMLARMEHRDLSKEVKEDEGVGVYVFIWAHIRRAIGDMRIYTSWGHTMPYYYMKDGELIRDGNFANGRRLTSSLYEFLNRSNMWNYLEVNLPVKTEERHILLTVEIIKKAKETYTKQFENDNFYVLIHPIDWEDFTPENNQIFKNMLSEKGIDYLDYSQKIILDQEHIIKGDGHPNEKSAEKTAKMLIKDLGIE